MGDKLKGGLELVIGLGSAIGGYTLFTSETMFNLYSNLTGGILTSPGFLHPTPTLTELAKSAFEMLGKLALIWGFVATETLSALPIADGITRWQNKIVNYTNYKQNEK